MRNAGISPPEKIVANGKIQRFHVDGDRRSTKNGWYVLYLDGIPAGAFGCWKREIRVTWSLKGESNYSAQEQEAVRRRMEEARRQRKAAERADRERAGKRARKLWGKAIPASANHPYLARKQVRPHGIRQLGDNVLVPVSSGGQVAGLQFIAPDGEKRFLKGTPKRGRYHPIGRPDGRLLIAEGYATAASLHEATGIATVVAFDANNLLPVAESIREQFPDSEIILAGDNDRQTEGNPGRRAAIDAARAVGGCTVLPDFNPGQEGTDWNDVALSRGFPAVAAEVMSHLRPRAIRAADVRPVEVKFAVENLATANEPALIVSEDGAGKTTFLLSILSAMAAGERVFDRFSVPSGPVLLVSEEDPASVLVQHAEAIASGHGWDVDRVLERLNMLALAGVCLDQKYWRRLVLDEVRRTGAIAVGLDPYTDLTNAKENDNDETRPFKAFLRELCRAGATPFICHHAGKASEGRSKRHRIRGASALAGAARSILFLEETAGGIAVEAVKLSRSTRHAPFTLSRQIDADPENPGRWVNARFTYMEEHQAAGRSADDFVLALLEKHGSLNSTGIREHSKGSGFSGQNISESLKRLHAARRITFDSGPRNAKNWKLIQPEEGGQGRQGSLPTLSDPAGQGAGGSGHPASL